MSEFRPRRSMLITPGNRPERMAKAVALDVDSVVFDLEDGVAPDHKAGARLAIANALQSLEFGRRERVVRCNAVGTPEHALDMDALPFKHIDALFVPKVESGDQLRDLAHRLTAIEIAGRLAHPVPIIATLETPRGILRALEIAEATERTVAIFFGSGDYTTATGAAVTERSLAAPRAIVAAAAAAIGAQAIDAAYFTDVKNAAATRADALIAKELGFAGKLLFHPGQVAVCNEVFTPSAREIAWAKKIVAGYEAAKAEGRGTAVVDGEFIAIDIALMAERMLKLARAVGAST